MAKNKGKSNYKRKNKKKETPIVEGKSFEENLLHYVKVATIIIVLFTLFYFVTFLITRDKTEKEESEEKKDSGFSYTEIMAGRSFSMDDGEYYVLFYDSSDEDNGPTYRSLAINYRNKEGAIPIYTVDMNKGLNKSYGADESNTNPTSAAELKINGPTLMKISNKTLALYVEGEESIKGYIE
ncbi:MAG: hypothetical protein IJG68_04665 [Bacilli bacterium]|nr:hypothetical protein [Bacilli bacterium]